MTLVQILLPLFDKAGKAFPATHFRRVRDELTDRFGGMTAYTRAPAEGRWKNEDEARVEHDEIVILEVMVPRLDTAWWRRYREELEQRFAQDEIVVRAQTVRLL